jgi:hypothetical protein
MKRYLTVSAAIALLLGGYVAANAELSPLLGTMNADNVTLYPGLMTYPAGGFHPMGLLYTTTATAATGAGTAEQTLGTFALPANALDVAGRRVRIRAAFHCATNANNKTMKLYFGASVITTPTAATSNKNAYLEMDVVKSGASTQIVWAKGLVDTTAVTPYVNAAGADTDTAAITIKATGTDGKDSASDITLDDMTVEYLN